MSDQEYEKIARRNLGISEGGELSEKHNKAVQDFINGFKAGQKWMKMNQVIHPGSKFRIIDDYLLKLIKEAFGDNFSASFAEEGRLGELGGLYMRLDIDLGGESHIFKGKSIYELREKLKKYRDDINIFE